MPSDELPQLDSLILRPTTNARIQKTLIVPTAAPALRRSPRKQSVAKPTARSCADVIADPPQLFASSQQRRSPRTQSFPKRAPTKATQTRNGRGTKTPLEGVPEVVFAKEKTAPRTALQDIAVIEDRDESDDGLADLLKSLSLQRHQGSNSEPAKENYSTQTRKKQLQPTSTMSRITQAARYQTEVKTARKGTSTKTAQPKRSNSYVLKEALCEDLNESSGAEEEDEDTDLSGFIVDDDADLTVHETTEESSSESEHDQKTRGTPRQKEKPQPSLRRRLVRGTRKHIPDIDDEADDQGLAKALDGTNLGRQTLENQKNIDKTRKFEIIDLTSSPAAPAAPQADSDASEDEDAEGKQQDILDPFSLSSMTLKLQPPLKSQPCLLPSKNGPLTASPRRPTKTKPKTTAPEQPVTPPGTPPQSPTKLKSPTKLLSPSKRATALQRSPHRQSMDAFWDHNVINEWHDVNSPKKVPILSPRKLINPLSRFNIFVDDAELSGSDLESQSVTNNSQDRFDTSTDSLPSPCESPAKPRSPSKISALRAQQQRIREEKRAKAAAKVSFDATKHQLATDLLVALDTHVTGLKVSTMSASTGGIRLIWSKTLRSTAGRANWKRTVTKPSGSPVKGIHDSQSIEEAPGVIVSHFASIELAEKIIDRPERLVNTLAHEFCHLANFMVSNVRDQPHGAEFQRWGRKVTSWLKAPAAQKTVGWREEWGLAEVTVKHSYVVETKYLWTCVGRPKEKMSLPAKTLELEGEDGCGAEYGRHSRSVDVKKQRCGRCKGFLVQVRPAPRAQSPRKASPVKGQGLRSMREESEGRSSQESGEGLGRLLEVVELNE